MIIDMGDVVLSFGKNLNKHLGELGGGRARWWW